MRFLNLLFLCLVPFSVAAVEYPSTGVEMKVHQVSEHVYYVSGPPGIATSNAGFISSAGFVITDEGVVLFDSLGTPSLGFQLLGKIRELTDQPIRRAYISHYHADHVYGAQVFEDAGAEIIAPDGASRYLESEVSSQRLEERRISLDPWVNEGTRLVYPDRYVKGEESFSLGGVDFRAVNVGSAHSDGDLILFVESDRVLFSGDIIFEGRIPFFGSTNSRQWLEILSQLAETDVNAIVPGHGLAARDPVALVSLTRNYLAYMRKVMAEAVENWVPFDEAYEAADWDDFIDFPAFFEANRRNAYSVYLSIEQEALE